MSGGGHIDDERLVALGLGEPPTAPEAQHLEACASCGGVAHEDARLWARLRALPQPTPPPGFGGAALQRFRARGLRHRPREVIAGSLAVLLMAAILCVWAWRLAPAVAVSFAQSLPRWHDAVSTGVVLTRVFGAALPVFVVAAGALLAAVAFMLRRLSAAASK